MYIKKERRQEVYRITYYIIATLFTLFTHASYHEIIIYYIRHLLHQLYVTEFVKSFIFWKNYRRARQNFLH